MTQDVTISQLAAQAGLKPPYVSIIVPVYNAEKQLEECLISAVFQTLPETEVIVVNDASPDNAQQVIDRFIKLFPDKVRCMVHDRNQGLSAARLTGVQNARAPYVAFLDSDDFISGRLCETLLRESLTNGYDICYFGSDWVDTEKGARTVKMPPKDFDAESMTRHGIASFWGGFFLKKFLLDNREVAFQDMRYEDAATTPVLLGLAEQLGACRTSMYFYNTGREGSITAGRMSQSKMEDLFQADVFPWENIAEELRPALTERIIKRALGSMNKFPEVYDYCVQHVRHLLQLTEGYEDSYPQAILKQLEEVRALPQEPLIPKRVYVNGFMRGQVRDFDRYLDQAAQAYLFDPEVVVLDGSACDTAGLPEWLRTAPAEDQGVYFALRRISEEGGIYISPSVTVTKSFNKEAFSGAFFVAGPENFVLPAAFGGEPGNAVIESMVKALERGPKPGKRTSVSEIMSLVLLGECGVHLSGREERGLHGLHMVHYKHIAREIQRNKSYCELNYSGMDALPEDAVVLPRILYDMAWNAADSDQEWLNSKIAGLNKELKAAQEELKKANGKLKKANAELIKTKKKLTKANKEMNAIKKSKAWRLIVRLRKIKDKVRSIFKA